MSEPKTPAVTEQELRDAFKKFDRDHSGLIDEEEFLASLGCEAYAQRLARSSAFFLAASSASSFSQLRCARAKTSCKFNKLIRMKTSIERKFERTSVLKRTTQRKMQIAWIGSRPVSLQSGGTPSTWIPPYALKNAWGVDSTKMTHGQKLT